jgi:hypothetical protein
MGHFAELDKDNKVLRVLTACNQDIANNGGEQSEQAALHFQSLNKFSEGGVKWVQTSYNHNFRARMASIGYTYNEEFNVFINPKPFPSWNLNHTTWVWEAPISQPITYINNPEGQNPPYEDVYDWDETNQTWVIRQP